MLTLRSPKTSDRLSGGRSPDSSRWRRTYSAIAVIEPLATVSVPP